ncbi:MAG TPA: M28 family metallopeptidase [Vicinamibacterales bacterium]|nr:M28 family metallopeptidase [Vicinamibacterales bacterium]
MRMPLLLAISLIPLAACGSHPPQAETTAAPPAASSAAAPAPAPQTPSLPISSMPKVDPKAILDHIKVLSADTFEGRAPGTKGEDLTVDYLQAQVKQLGLEPGNTDGTYIQKVPLVGITGTPASSLTFSKPGRALGLKWKDEVVAWTKHVADSAAIDKSDVIFCGYGVEAPEYQWNDFKDVDVKGKTIVVLVNDPPVPDPSNPSRLDANTFRGDAMTYYGRWTYKFEEGARKGAAAVFIVHETGPAGYPFSVVQGNLDEKFDIVTPDDNMGRSNIEGWITTAAARKLFAMAGQDFDALKKQAVSRDFEPVPLGVKASMTIHNTLRRVASRNVVAKLEGSDPRLKDEYVIYTAHWDHLGVGEPVNGDKIYNGALDNAAGVGSVLEIARAFTTIQPKPRRSVLFLFVTAEEQMLLGSQYYATNPIYPLRKTAAEINEDGVNQWGRTKDLTIIGLGASDLDDYARAAAQEQGRTLRPDPEPEKGFYYRSDHFSFAKQGVPALDPDAGVDFIGKPAGWGQQKRNEYTNHDYHAPSDEIKPDWDLSGAAEDADLLLAVGYRVANSDHLPEWKPGNEFKAKRDAMMK